MTKRDYYEILGVDRGADGETLKKAYRRMARQSHPDVNPGDAEAESRFKEINEAYQVLTDDKKRAAYDRYGHDGLQGGAGPGDYGMGGFGDIFDIFFGGGGGRQGGRQTGPRRGADTRYDLEITYEQAAAGAEVEIEIPSSEDCGACKGTGSASASTPAKCARCNGAGELRQTRQTLFGTMVNSQTCPSCGGAGRTITDPCRECRGRGKKPISKTLRVGIPAGVDTGQRLRVTAEGGEGDPGAPRGDLYVFIILRDHEFFKRDGQDVFCEVPVSMIQATLGDEIKVPTLYGEYEKIKIHPGTQPGTIFRVRERGFPHLRGRHKGDQHVLVKVQVPNKLDSKQRKAFEEFGRLMGEEVSRPQDGFFGKMKSMFKQ